MITFSMHSNDYACPFCNQDKIDMFDKNVIEKLVTERFVRKDFDRMGNEVVVFECPYCFEKYYYHLRHDIVDQILENKINKLDKDIQTIINKDNIIDTDEQKVIDDIKNIKKISYKILKNPKQEQSTSSKIWIVYIPISILLITIIAFFIIKKGKRRRR